MTYSIDDVRVGDVVTYEIGEPRTAGYVQRTVTIVNMGENGMGRMRPSFLNSRIKYNGARIIDVHRPAPALPDGVGAMVFVDGGVAVHDGEAMLQWRTFCTIGDEGMVTAGRPSGYNPEEALPVPAEPLRALLAAWDEMGDYQQRVGEGSSAPAPRVVVSTKIAAFIESTRAEWERAGITP